MRPLRRFVAQVRVALRTMTVTKLRDGTEQADFRYDFALDGKALETDVDENGDLWIQGYASDWGLDRQEEAFEPGSFQRGLKSFLERNPIMLYHHQYDKALGQFVDARVDENGLWVKGRVDAPAIGSWAEDVFNKIRKGTIKSFSVGGIFRRRATNAGPRIYDVDLGEISVTPFPVNPRTTFSVVAKKAFDSEEAVAAEVIPPEAETVECETCKAAEEAKVAEEERVAAEVRASEEAQAGSERDTTEVESVIDRLESLFKKLSGEAKEDLSYLPSEDALHEETAEIAAVIGDTPDLPEVDEEGKAVSSSSLPDLKNEPGKTNWVEKAGGLKQIGWIYRCAKHLQAKGMPVGVAIATAINAAKKMCATGDLNWPGEQQVNFGSRAEACASVAAWERLKASSHAD